MKKVTLSIIQMKDGNVNKFFRKEARLHEKSIITVV